MEWNTMEEYLIQIGADIDQNSFNSAKSALSELKAHLMKLKGSAAPLALASAIGAIGKAAYDTVKGVAKADMEYTRLAASMWTTKETAKALSVAMKTMGVSQDDIAWVPELRQQFFRLRAEMQRFATPADADAQLRYIREIGYDIQALFVRLKMLKAWVAYYLIQYLEPYIKDFKAFINWLLEKVGTDMPGLARKVARAMSTVLSPVLATIKVLGMAIGKVYDFIASLPDNVKKWGAIFAAVGAVIMSGPFGLMIAGLSAAMLLLEDFVGYMNGWDSSADLAPIWEALLAFKEGTGAEWLEKFKRVLGDIADILDHIITELKIEEVLKSIKEAIEESVKGTKMLWETNLKGLEALLKLFKVGKNDVKSFFTALADEIVTNIKNLSEFAKLFGKLLQTAALLKRGEVGKAWDLFKDSVVEFGTNLGNNLAELQKRRNSRLDARYKEYLARGWEAGEALRAEWSGEGYGLKTQGANIDEQVANLKEKWQEALPAIGGILKEAGLGDSEISSGARTEAHNAEVGGSPTSWHIDYGDGGDAVDIVLPDDTTDAQAAAIKKYFEETGAFEEVLFHDAGSGYHLHLGGYKPGVLHAGVSDNPAEIDSVGDGECQKVYAGVDDANSYAMAQDVPGDTSAPAPAASFMSGSNEMAMSPLEGIFKALQRPTEFKPNIQIPQMGMPDINIPEMRMPPFPDVNIPDIRIPDINIPQMQIPKFDIPVMTVADNSYAAGRDETPILPQAGGGTSNSYAIDMGTPVININVAGSNASPKEIAGAVKDGMTGWLDSALMNIQARNMRRPVV